MDLLRLNEKLKMELAFLYRLADMNDEEIAERLGVKPAVVARWSRVGRWDERLDELASVMTNTIGEVAEEVVRHRIALARRALRLTDVTLQMLSQELGRSLKGKDLLRAAEVVSTIAERHSRVAEALVRLERERQLMMGSDESELLARAIEWDEGEVEDEVSEEE